MLLLVVATKMSTLHDLKQCGIKFDPPAIVLTYKVKATNKLHKRTMPLRGFAKSSPIDKTADDLRQHPRHGKYLEKMSLIQLQKLLTIIQDKMKGISLDDSLKKNNKLLSIDPEEDLNKVDEDTLVRKKAVMDESFEKNRKKIGDDDFQYDVEVDFDQDNGHIESIDWDEDSDDEF